MDSGTFDFARAIKFRKKYLVYCLARSNAPKYLILAIKIFIVEYLTIIYQYYCYLESK
jgi:hypothetical protein